MCFRMTEFCLFINLLFLTVVVYVNGATPEVTLPTGKVEGYQKKTVDGKIYTAYEGIPYARPPVGKHRFEEPKPIKPWVGTWQAKTLSKCMQYNQYTTPGDDYVIGEEDCLHVNVYTPETNNTFRDVIVYIHGGAFMFNHGGSYGEKYLINYDIVYVTFNYRLGPLGFLSTDSRLMPGNNGLKDQHMALMWIKENIKYFGGNPESITLSGMSAGGASVHLHTMSPRMKDNPLFHKAIVQSGTALNPWVIAEQSRQKTVKLASIVGCPSPDTREMIKCLKFRPARQIVDAVKHFQPWLYNPFSPFGVVIDKWSDAPIIPEHPYRLLKSKQVMNIPIIFSNVDSEGLYPTAEFLGNNHLEELDSRWNDLIPFILDYNYTLNPEEIVDATQKIRKFYFADEKLSETNFPKLIQMCTDRLFVVDIERSARLHAAAISEPTYYYFYRYRGANSKSEKIIKTKKNYGASHGDDTIMILSTDIDTTSTADDRAMSKLLQEMWISFSKTGVPSIREVIWEKMSNNSADPLKFLDITSPTDVKLQSAEYLGNRVNFWDLLPFNENANIKSVKDEL